MKQWREKDQACERIEFSSASRYRSLAASLLKMQPFRRIIEERGNNKWPARPMSGGYAARRSPIRTGLWLACNEIANNSARHVARSLSQRSTRVATTSRDTIGIIGQGVIANTSSGRTTETIEPVRMTIGPILTTIGPILIATTTTDPGAMIQR